MHNTKPALTDDACVQKLEQAETVVRHLRKEVKQKHEAVDVLAAQADSFEASSNTPLLTPRELRALRFPKKGAASAIESSVPAAAEATSDDAGSNTAELSPRELRAQRFPKSSKRLHIPKLLDESADKAKMSYVQGPIAAFQRTLSELSDADPKSPIAALHRTLSEMSDADPQSPIAVLHRTLSCPNSPIQDMTIAAFHRTLSGMSAGSA